MTVISVNDEITLTAHKRIEMVGGNSKVVLDAGNIEFATPGKFIVKAASHSWGKGAKASGSLEALPDSRTKLFDEAFVLKDEKTGKPLASQQYRIQRADGTYEYGVTGPDGATHLVSSVDSEALTIELLQAR